MQTPKTCSGSREKGVLRVFLETGLINCGAFRGCCCDDAVVMSCCEVSGESDGQVSAGSEAVHYYEY